MNDLLNTEPDEDVVDLPSLVRKNPAKELVIPELPTVTGAMSDAEVNRAHLQMSNLELNLIYHALPQAKSVTQLTKLIDMSIKSVKHQRDLLCLPYGHKGAAERKDVVFPPIDD